MPSHDPQDRRKLTINNATVSELSEAFFIGDKLARAIVRFREDHGPFKSIEDLKEVPGIGTQRLQYLRENLNPDQFETSGPPEHPTESESYGPSTRKETGVQTPGDDKYTFMHLAVRKAQKE